MLVGVKSKFPNLLRTKRCQSLSKMMNVTLKLKNEDVVKLLLRIHIWHFVALMQMPAKLPWLFSHSVCKNISFYFLKLFFKISLCMLDYNLEEVIALNDNERAVKP